MLSQGMNFDFMWSVHGKSDILFWEIAIPMMIFIITVFFWAEFGRMFKRLKKRMQHKKIDKVSTDLLFSSQRRHDPDAIHEAQAGLATLYNPSASFTNVLEAHAHSTYAFSTLVHVQICSHTVLTRRSCRRSLSISALATCFGDLL